MRRTCILVILLLFFGAISKTFASEPAFTFLIMSHKRVTFQKMNAEILKYAKGIGVTDIKLEKILSSEQFADKNNGTSIGSGTTSRESFEILFHGAYKLRSNGSWWTRKVPRVPKVLQSIVREVAPDITFYSMSANR